MPKKHYVTERIAQEAAEQEFVSAQEAGTVGYLTKIFVQTTLPHTDLTANYSDGRVASFERENGYHTLLISVPAKIGLPFGTIPRIFLCWACTEALKTGSPHLSLGRNLTSFMRNIGLVKPTEGITGGTNGNITRVRNQIKRMMAASVTNYYDDGRIGNFQVSKLDIIADGQLFWTPKNPEIDTLFASTMDLGERFFKMIQEHPIPLDLRVIHCLKKSPFAIDIYCWLTYRLSYLEKKTSIPWEYLKQQFGSSYKDKSKFKQAFCARLKQVLELYNANVQPTKSGLELSPTLPHVSKIYTS